MKQRISNYVYIVWVIALKDIVDAIQSRLIVALILTQVVMLSLPKVLPLILVSPSTEVLLYDSGDSLLAAELENSSQYKVRKASSFQEMEEVLINSISNKLGFEIPADFNEVLEVEGMVEIDGYMNWSDRGKAQEWKKDFEEQFSALLGKPVRINVQENYVYPAPEFGLGLGITAITVVLVVLTVGINLVPSLMIEEKQTRTMEALLVSPASIPQVVVGKALVGVFYILVASGIAYIFYWRGVVHWEVAALFVFGMAVFSVAVGLVLGSIFNSQQEMIGWMTALLVIFVGAMIVGMLTIDIPTWLQAIIPWVPSVSLLDVFRYSFSPNVPWTQIWADVGGVLGISFVLYAVVVWLVWRMDR